MHQAHWKAAEMHQLAGASTSYGRGTQRKRGSRSGSLAFGTGPGVFGSRLQACQAGP
jgi:hypothetical protein